MVTVAQLVEPRTVTPVVVGSSLPSVTPLFLKRLGLIGRFSAPRRYGNKGAIDPGRQKNQA